VVVTNRSPAAPHPICGVQLNLKVPKVSPSDIHDGPQAINPATIARHESCPVIDASTVGSAIAAKRTPPFED